MSDMQYMSLGNSGLKVSKIILGAMSYGKSAWAPWVLEDEDYILDLMKKAYDAGIRTFDTADVYSNGYSETLVGKFLKKYNIHRSTIVIFSKVYFPVNEGTWEWRRKWRAPENDYLWVNGEGLSRKHIMDAVEDSTRRLGTYIDVYQIHRMDKSTPKEEIMEALHDVVKSGKVRYLGSSSMRATEFAQLQFIAEKHGWTKFISMQNYYNLIYREEEREMIPFCKENGVGLIPWSPIAAGMLARPLGTQTVRSESTQQQVPECDQPIVKRVEEVAQKKGCSMSAISIAWAIAKGCAPIVGLSKPERIEDACSALSVKLDDEEMKYLEEPYVPHKVTGF